LDLVRIFEPNFEWLEVWEDGAQRIRVEESGDIHKLYIDEFCLESSLAGRVTPQERRRASALVLYEYLAEVFGERSRWGTLTGMRPNKLVHRKLDDGVAPNGVREWLMEEYHPDQSKADLLVDIAVKQRPFFSDYADALKQAGVYIAIPFCPTRCAYCSFPGFALPKPKILNEYMANLEKEIRAIGQATKAKGQKIVDLYIGGGTPTTLSATQMDALLYLIEEAFGGDFLEFTVEAGRPDTITPEKLEVLKRHKVGRISINPQSMWEPTLAEIGRKHTVQDIIDKYQMARSVGFDSINMDLIIGLPKETCDNFRYTLDQIGALMPDNLTIHTLAVKRSSRLKEEGNFASDLKEVMAMADYAEGWVKEHGYEPYYIYRQKHMLNNLENVGYALPGKESRYNILMMEERETIYGLGVGSSSKYLCTDGWNLDGDFNPKDLIMYNERIEEIIRRKVDKIQALS